MAQHSPEFIEKTISVFESRTGRVISEEDAWQAVENISGFFRVLREWAEVEDREKSPESPGRSSRGREGG
jgi:hypothetical protein